MTIDEQRKLVFEFIKPQRFAVISSMWEGKPQSAVVVFSLKHEFELIFGTNNTTRKHRNLTANPNVAVVIGWDDNITIQYEGTAEEVPNHEIAEYRAIHLEKSPGSALYAYLETQRYFRLTPRWIRYTDITPEPEFTFELSFPPSPM